MTAVNEIDKIPNPPLMRKKFRTDEVYKMIEVGILPEESGWELINGEIIHRMTIGSKHAAIVKRLNRLLTMFLGQNAIVSVQDPIRIDVLNEPEPDICVLRPRDDFYADEHPEPNDVMLAIEVSDSTLEFDRDVKKEIYAEAGIVEFWIINIKENVIEAFSEPENRTYFQMQIYSRGETIKTKNTPEILLSVSEILGEESSEIGSEN
jgi:Uma2 family endonuclease